MQTNEKLPNKANLPKLACLISLGCKVNKYEIDCMANILKNAGWDIIFDLKPADLYIVNTCAVTNIGEKKSRQYISKLSKLNPDAKIIVCGCASENSIDQFKKLGVTSIIGNIGKEKILDLIETPTYEKFEFTTTYDHNLKMPVVSQTRAYIKVQDGCNNFCSYCLIPYLRGRSRSRNLDEVVKEASVLSKTCPELVITGIDLSTYKIDGVLSLGKLVKSLSHLPSRIRLGSLEVNVISKDFLEDVLSTPNFCPQFHLSLQSGSNTVLKRMNRHYTCDEYLEKVKLIKKYFPDANITTDVIVGFAGESDQEFLETIDTCKKAGFGNMHIFPYSKRKGTRAFDWECPNGLVVEKRIKMLEGVKAELTQNYHNQIKDKVFNLLVEEKEDGYYTGYTENYVKVYVEDKVEPNKIYKVKLLKTFKSGMLAKLV